ncbi:MAG: tripartite tricarboxylate transporter substrate binding protein [Syntrophaceae bacterium]|jgi:tripartite-type tricarboxylate transporter receptor subunit TctC|nr:tripartite tricarboxylate transporter substrate binding protein [Syntrophaceae bacterium]
MKKRIPIGLILLVLAFFGLTQAAPAQDKYPSKPVEIIVSWAAGGATDVIFRAVATVFPRYANNQQMIVKNIPGGGAAIGYTEAMKAKGDGYTTVAVATPMITKIHMSNVKFSATTFAPVIQISDNACYLMVHKDSPYKDLRDYIADAKKRPGQINMGNAGAGGGYHMASLAFQNFVGIKLNHIPFEGGGPSITALMGKHVDSIIVSAPEGVPQALAGNLKLLGVFGDERLEKFKEVPTAKELGIAFNIGMWRGVAVPKDTPAAIQAQLHDILKKCMGDADFKKKCEELSVQLMYRGPKDFEKFILAEDARYRDLIIREKLGERYK